MESQIQKTQSKNERSSSLVLYMVQIWFFLLGLNFFSSLAFRLAFTGVIELWSFIEWIVFWIVARGLALRVNFFRIFAIVLSVAWILIDCYFIWQILSNGTGYGLYYMGRPDPRESSRIWLYVFLGINFSMSSYTIVALLKHDVIALFKKANLSQVN